MPMTTINLTEENSEKLEAIARRTGKSRDELLNQAVETLVGTPDSRAPTGDWKDALMQAAGMWKDRDDIPELMSQIRQESDRVLPAENPKPTNSDWKDAWRRVEGMWRDRDDLPDFEEIRRSWDRPLALDNSK